MKYKEVTIMFLPWTHKIRASLKIWPVYIFLLSSILLGVIFFLIFLGMKGFLLLNFEVPATIKVMIPFVLFYAIQNHIRSIKYMGPMWNCGPKMHSNHNLVVEGPYGFVRHPIYLSANLYFWICTAIFQNYLSAGLALYGTVVLTMKAAFEEMLLRERFGETHNVYSKRVPFLFPKKGIIFIAIVVILSIITGCSFPVSKKTIQVDAFDESFLLPLKFYHQDPDKCGIAALRSVCDYYLVECRDLERIFNPAIHGIKLVSLVNYSEQYFQTSIKRLNYKEITQILDSKRPIILFMNNARHYYLIVGYMNNDDKLVVHDGYNANVILPATIVNKETGIAVIFSRKEDSSRLHPERFKAYRTNDFQVSWPKQLRQAVTKGDRE